MLVLRCAIPFIITWAMPCKIYLQAYADSESLDQPAKSVQSDQVLPCLQTESLNNTECMNEEQRPSQYFVHAQDDLNLCILHMFEDTFLLGMTKLKHMKNTFSPIQLM